MFPFPLTYIALVCDEPRGMQHDVKEGKWSNGTKQWYMPEGCTVREWLYFQSQIHSSKHHCNQSVQAVDDSVIAEHSDI